MIIMTLPTSTIKILTMAIMMSPLQLIECLKLQRTNGDPVIMVSILDEYRTIGYVTKILSVRDANRLDTH